MNAGPIPHYKIAAVVRSSHDRRTVLRGLGLGMISTISMAHVAGCALGQSQPGPDETVAGPPDASLEGRKRAAVLLERLGAVAAALPAIEVSDNDIIYVRTDQATVGVRRVHQAWLDPSGMIALKVSSSGGGDDFVWPKVIGSTEHNDALARSRSLLAKHGPSILCPTQGWLASLPADPGALLAELRRGVEADADQSQNVQRTLLDSYQRLLSHAWPLISPEKRLSLYTAMALIPSVGADSLGPTMLDGRSVCAVALAGDEEPTALLFDPSTGCAIGWQGSPQVWEFWKVSVVAKDELAN